jgi:uncharacterized delta-60 repeat protein
MADDLVTALAVQPDGRILVGGFVHTLAGQPRQALGRLWPDGNLDAGFHPIVTGQVYSVIVQGEGGVVLGGEITSVDGQPRTNIARVQADGSLDAGFNPGANGRVFSMAVQADGKLLVGGLFNRLGGQARSGLGRFNVDGSLDSDFHPVLPSGVVPYGIQTMAVQADGKILVGGVFGNGSDLSPTNLARVHPDGQTDHEFNPGIRGLINCLAVDRDGRILVGGSFRIPGGMGVTKLARLQADGTVDGSFDPSTNAGGLLIYTEPESIALSMDGNITVGASMLQPAPAARAGLAFAGLAFLYRLRSDGALDHTFNGGANGLVHGVAVQSDGKILAGGEFSMLGGAPRSRIGRLTSGSAALQTLTVSDNGGTAIWTRNGSAPEVEPVIFETSTDGTNYNLVGPALRVGNSWQQRLARTPGFTGILYVRARGRTVGGYFNGSSGLIESVAQFWRSPPPFLSSVQVLGGGALPIQLRQYQRSLLHGVGEHERDLAALELDRAGFAGAGGE